jgi:hypothetical protein
MVIVDDGSGIQPQPEYAIKKEELHMTLFESLVIAHLIGDWLLQTEWQALNKIHDWRAMFSHLLVYHAVLLTVLGVRFGFDEPVVYGVVGVLAVLHGILDRRGFTQWLMKTLRISVQRAPDRWLSMAVDQTLHIVLLAGAAVFLSRVFGG